MPDMDDEPNHVENALARATAREVLPMDYVKFARAKGLSERRVVGVHVLKNIMAPARGVRLRAMAHDSH